jgi:hypothetical protein
VPALLPLFESKSSLRVESHQSSSGVDGLSDAIEKNNRAIGAAYAARET